MAQLTEAELLAFREMLKDFESRTQEERHRSWALKRIKQVETILKKAFGYLTAIYIAGAAVWVFLKELGPTK